MRTPFRFAAALALSGAMLAACSGGATPTPAPTAAPSTAPSESVAPSASVAPSLSPSACASLTTVTAGTLTIGTSNPPYPPYYQIPASGDPTKPWQLGDPTNGEGFESAFAYALASKMGFAKDKVAWIEVPFDSSYAPTAKKFDIDVNQVSYTPDRAAAVDMSDGYYYLSQAVVALKTNPLAQAKTVTELKKYKFGAQQGTTSYDTIVNTIKPDTAPSVYSSNDDAISALKAKQIDGIVVDLPTAFYVTAAQILDAEGNSLANIVGQFPNEQGANAEHFSVVLAKGTPLTACVNESIAAMIADGSLAQITQEWLADKANAPVFAP